MSPAENDSEQSEKRSEEDCAMQFLQQMRLELRRCQAENETLRAKLEAEKEKSRMWKTQVNQKARKNAKLKLQIIELEEEAQERAAAKDSSADQPLLKQLN